jgi:hypothetical protein
MRLSVLGLEQFQDGWPTGKSFSGAHEWGQSAQQRLLCCESVRVVYVLEKLPDVSGTSLIEAGRYSSHSLRSPWLNNSGYTIVSWF